MAQPPQQLAPQPLHPWLMNSPRRPRSVSAIEQLESRIAPATLIVTSLADDGSPETLRSKVIEANATPAADTIVFQPGLAGPIVLDGNLQVINITAPLTIKGPGADKISISGSDKIHVFFVDDGDAATL